MALDSAKLVKPAVAGTPEAEALLKAQKEKIEAGACCFYVCSDHGRGPV